MGKIDLWPVFWMVLVVSFASCTYGTRASYNECVKSGAAGCYIN